MMTFRERAKMVSMPPLALSVMQTGGSRLLPRRSPLIQSRRSRTAPALSNSCSLQSRYHRLSRFSLSTPEWLMRPTLPSYRSSGRCTSVSRARLTSRSSKPPQRLEYLVEFEAASSTKDLRSHSGLLFSVRVRFFDWREFSHPRYRDSLQYPLAFEAGLSPAIW